MKSAQDNKNLIRQYHQELDTTDEESVHGVVEKYTSSGYQWYGVHPFNEQTGAEAVVDTFWKPLLKAFSHIQRRADIFMAGTNEIAGDEWVVSMGHFMGLFQHNWLGIPATHKMAFLRYAEFNCIADGKIIKTAFFCDIIDVMNQAGVYPLPTQAGASFLYPGPKTHDGLLFGEQDQQASEKTLTLVNQMISDLDELNKSSNNHCSPEYLARTWHDDMVWYGPEGIGGTYTITDFQEKHQIPFRTGLKDKVFNGHVCRFAEGNYAGFFGWPNLSNTVVGGFLGLPGKGIRADMRVVDIYRREGDKLAENWVFIDLPYWLKQQGLDILERAESLVH